MAFLLKKHCEQNDQITENKIIYVIRNHITDGQSG